MLFLCLWYLSHCFDIFQQGLKTVEKNHLLSIFRPRHSSGFVTGSSLSSSPKHDTSSIRKLNNLIKKNFVVGSNEWRVSSLTKLLDYDSIQYFAHKYCHVFVQNSITLNFISVYHSNWSLYGYKNIKYNNDHLNRFCCHWQSPSHS